MLRFILYTMLYHVICVKYEINGYYILTSKYAYVEGALASLLGGQTMSEPYLNRPIYIRFRTVLNHT